MKNLSKSLKVVLLSVITIGMLVSCNDETSETSPIEPQEPKMIEVGFDGYVLTPESQKQRKSSVLNEEDGIVHTYVTTGYTVQVQGGVSDGFDLFKNVDLESAKLAIEVVGDVTITVFHPDFVEDAVVEMAYYGSEDTIPYAEESSYTITTELVQGFIIVVEGDGAEGVIENVGVNGTDGKTHDIAYYSGAANMVVDVYTFGNDLQGDEPNIIGAGVKYTVNSDGELIEFVLPEFGVPDDGELVPIN